MQKVVPAFLPIPKFLTARSHSYVATSSPFFPEWIKKHKALVLTFINFFFEKYSKKYFNYF